jgi:sec-independent protein translocase protein TatB
VLNFPDPTKILLLAVIALVVMGPTRLPGAARTAGKWIGELRKLTSRFQDEISGALGDSKDGITSAVGDLTREVGGWRNEVMGLGKSVTSAVSSTTSTVTGAIPSPLKPATWTTPETYAPSTSSVDSVSPGPVRPGLPSLPPVPDDPSLN